MTMHTTCIEWNGMTYIHAFRAFTPARESVGGVNGTWPLRKAAAESGHQACSAAGAVLAARALALAGAWACRTLGRRGRACLLVSSDLQVARGRAQQVLWALEWPARTFANGLWVLWPLGDDAHARFRARSDGARGPAGTGRSDGPAGLCAACCVLCAAVCLSHDGFVQCRVVPCAMLWSVRAWCGVMCRVLACGGGASRACRVLGACSSAARRSGGGPPCVSTWTF